MDNEPVVQKQEETLHEPHKHARPRLFIGIGAIMLITVGVFVWMRWGNKIQETCFGDGEVCAVELPESI